MLLFTNVYGVLQATAPFPQADGGGDRDGTVRARARQQGGQGNTFLSDKVH